jgi:IS605 OrfB family transposase
MKAYKFKLKMNQRFAANCAQTLNICRELYNAALQERREAYRVVKVSVNFHSQAMQLPEIKLIRDDVEAIHSQVLQDTLRKLSKAVRLLGKKHLKVQNQRKDFFHKTSLRLIREFDEITVEDLNIKGLLKNHHLAKSISDASWRTFLTVLENKAANAGRRVWKVAAAFTSQDCSQCGDRVKKSLSQREHRWDWVWLCGSSRS